MNIINTIFPIFIVILMGLLAKKRGLIPDSFLKPANQLTFYLAIPAMIFRAIVKSDFRSQFDLNLLTGTLIPLFIVFTLFWIAMIVLKVPKNQRGTLVESAVHGNLGYIGLAVVFYYLGPEALASTGILLAFVMLTHNGLAVVVMQVNSESLHGKKGFLKILSSIIINPIIFTAIIAIFFSLFQIQLPTILDRTLGIIGNLALPLALLLIGASLSFQIEMQKLLLVIFACLAKLILLPAIGIWFYYTFELPASSFLPGLILLTAPVATVSYVIALEMNGDPELAVTTISVSTALSAVTILFWLSLVEYLQ